MPIIHKNAAGTAKVELTIIPVQTACVLKRTFCGCFVKKDANCKEFIKNFLSEQNSPDLNKYERSEYLFYSPVKFNLEGEVTEAVISYTKIPKDKKSMKQKKCSLKRNPLIITFDGHLFLCCDFQELPKVSLFQKKDLNKSKFLKEHSKKITCEINQILDLNKGFHGLGKRGGCLQFIPFKMQVVPSQTNIYKINITDFDELEKAGPLLLEDKKTIVGCYTKRTEGSWRIEIDMLRVNQGMSSTSCTDGCIISSLDTSNQTEQSLNILSSASGGGTGEAPGTLPSTYGSGTGQAPGTLPSASGGGTGQVPGTLPYASGGGTGQAPGTLPSAYGSGTEQAPGTLPSASGGGTGQAPGTSTFQPEDRYETGQPTERFDHHGKKQPTPTTKNKYIIQPIKNSDERNAEEIGVSYESPEQLEELKQQLIMKDTLRQIHLQQPNEEPDEYEIHFQQLYEELEEYKIHFQQLNKKLEEYKIRFQQLNEEPEEYKIHFQQLNEELEEYKIRFQQLNEELEEYKIHFQQLNKKLEEYKIRFQQLYEELEEYKIHFQQLYEELEENKTHSRQLNEELEEYKTHSRQLNEEPEKYKIHFQQLNEELKEQYKMHFQRLNEELEEYKIHSQQFNEELEEKNRRLYQQKNELQEGKGQLKQQNEKLQEYKKQNEKLEEKNREFKQQNEELKSDKGQLKQHKKELEKKNGQLEQQNDKLEGQNRQLRQQKLIYSIIFAVVVIIICLRAVFV